MQKLELLCPAKNLESGILAINYGADAVYVGATKFGARSSATNSVGDIEKLCRYAHRFNAKVFVAFNTLLYENELKEAESIIRQLCDAGIDALIIQDTAILEMNIPPVVLHASTQMHNFKPERIQFLEKAGFDRIVLARELSLEEIKAVRAITTCELESFIHGALCVSLSGQCYISEERFGRSANRGECAQVCRMPFTLKDNKGRVLLRDKHLLSLKDLNATEHLKSLTDAGVMSFKIEGRLKDRNYVINNTAWYRQQLDNIIEERTDYMKASNGNTRFTFLPEPGKTFSRGYTDYFLSERRNSLANMDTPKSTGKKIGKIVRSEGNKLSVKFEKNIEINNGDGLCFIDNEGGIAGFLVNGISGNTITANKAIEVNKETDVYRNFDHEFEKMLNNNHDHRKLNVALKLIIANKILNITLRDEAGRTTTLTIEKSFETARNSAMAKDNFVKQLSKSGESDFEVREVAVPDERLPFIPVGELNDIRRKLFALHVSNILESYLPQQRKSNYANFEQKKALTYADNVCNSLAEKFYNRFESIVTEPSFEKLTPEEKATKPLMTTRYCLKFELGICQTKQDPPKTELAEPLFIEDRTTRYRLKFDCKACLMQVFKG